ncbi:MAG: hypothetical protein GY774_27365 [Planctomycetes bacterium]|nr:hypothetical protein [Planctomycetota bacterium]
MLRIRHLGVNCVRRFRRHIPHDPIAPGRLTGISDYRIGQEAGDDEY